GRRPRHLGRHDGTGRQRPAGAGRRDDRHHLRLTPGPRWSSISRPATSTRSAPRFSRTRFRHMRRCAMPGRWCASRSTTCSLTVFPDAMGMARENRRFLLPYGNMVFNSFGPQNEFFTTAVADAEPVLAWLQQQMQRQSFAPGGFGAAIHAAADTGELTPEETP